MTRMRSGRMARGSLPRGRERMRITPEQGYSTHLWRAKVALFTLLAVASLTAGCSRRPATAPWPAPRPLAGEYPSPARPGGQPATVAMADSTLPATHPPRASASVPGMEHDAEGDSPAEPTGSLALDDALALALQVNPALTACAHEVAAEEARAFQSGLWPNPELDFRRDHLAVTEVDGEKDDPRTRIILSQVLALGGTPGRRRAVG